MTNCTCNLYYTALVSIYNFSCICFVYTFYRQVMGFLLIMLLYRVSTIITTVVQHDQLVSFKYLNLSTSFGIYYTSRCTVRMLHSRLVFAYLLIQNELSSLFCKFRTQIFQMSNEQKFSLLYTMLMVHVSVYDKYCNIYALIKQGQCPIYLMQCNCKNQ